jgi:hypothetical protein
VRWQGKAGGPHGPHKGRARWPLSLSLSLCMSTPPFPSTPFPSLSSSPLPFPPLPFLSSLLFLLPVLFSPPFLFHPTHFFPLPPSPSLSLPLPPSPSLSLPLPPSLPFSPFSSPFPLPLLYLLFSCPSLSSSLLFSLFPCLKMGLIQTARRPAQCRVAEFSYRLSLNSLPVAAATPD